MQWPFFSAALIIMTKVKAGRVSPARTAYGDQFRAKINHFEVILTWTAELVTTTPKPYSS